jgi:hypothetical protein
VSATVLLFLYGISATAAWVCGLFFFRFWRRSGDPLFGFFGAGFWLLSGSWILLALLYPAEESRPYIYGVRLIAFVLLILGIVAKNRSAGHQTR